MKGRGCLRRVGGGGGWAGGGGEVGGGGGGRWGRGCGGEQFSIIDSKHFDTFTNLLTLNFCVDILLTILVLIFERPLN